MLSQERSLFENTVGIIFLGTPHRGIEDLRPNWWVGMKIDVLRWSLDWYEEYRIVREIQAKRSEEGEAGGLLSVSSTFVEFYNAPGSHTKPEIHHFTEGRATSMTKATGENAKVYPTIMLVRISTDKAQRWIVTQTSGRLDIGHYYTLPADHFQLNKFTGPNDELYQRVSDKIKKMYQKTLDLAPEVKRVLERLPEVPADFTHAEAGECLAGTRDQIMECLNGATKRCSDAPRFIYILGPPGTGKSTIIKTLALQMEKAGISLISFFFSITATERDRPILKGGKVVTSLACQLARIHVPYRARICDYLIDQDISTWTISTWSTALQFRKLIVEPLKHVAGTRNLYLVIDALDESSDDIADAVRFLKMLHSEMDGLPNLRLVITSRPHDEFSSFINKLGDIYKINLAETTDENAKDVRLYLSDNLETMSKSRPKRFPDGEDAVAVLCDKLANAADGLFEVAAIYLRQIETKRTLPAKKVIDSLLEPRDSSGSIYDTLYRRVLEGSLGDADSRDLFKLIAGGLLCTKEAVTADSLAHLLSSPPMNMHVQLVIDELAAIIATGTNGTISLYHSSCRDFLLGTHEFTANVAGAQQELASSTLDIVQRELKFNICKLSTSYRLNSQAPELKDDKIGDYIPPHLSYACRHWVPHRVEVPQVNLRSEEHYEDVDKFIQKKGIFWVEALSLLAVIGIAERQMWQLAQWRGVSAARF